MTQTVATPAVRFFPTAPRTPKAAESLLQRFVAALLRSLSAMSV
jgi:hypothetical protein